MDKLGKIFLKYSGNIVYTLFSLIILLLFLISLFGTCAMSYADEHVYFLKDAVLPLAGGLAALIFAAAWMKGRTQYKKRGKQGERILPAVTVCWLICMLLFIFYIDLKPYQDPGSVYEAAGAFLKGDYTQWSQAGYLYTFPFQNGLVLLELPFWLVFGEKAYLAIQVYNLFLWLAAMLGLSWLAGQFFGESAAKLTYAALLLFVPMWFYVTYCYGTLPGLAFGVFAMCGEVRFEKTGRVLELLKVAVCLFLAVMYKSNYEIIAVAVMLMLLLYGIREKEKKALVGIALMIAAVGLESALIPEIMRRITGEDTGNGIPMIAWVAMGLKESNIAPGWYNRFTVLAYEKSGYQAETVKALSLESIRETFSIYRRNPDYTARFFARKTASLWSQPAFEGFTVVTKRNISGTLPYWIRDMLYNGGIVNTVLFFLLNIYQSMVYFGVLLHLALERKRLQLRHALCLIVFLGGFLFHIFWEGKCQYTVIFYIMLFPYAASGFLKAAQSIKRALKEKTLKEKIYGSAPGKMGIALAVCILLLTAAQDEVFADTFHIQGDESEYLWFCTNDVKWKDSGYHFGDSYE